MFVSKFTPADVRWLIVKRHVFYLNINGATEVILQATRRPANKPQDAIHLPLPPSARLPPQAERETSANMAAANMAAAERKQPPSRKRLDRAAPPLLMDQHKLRVSGPGWPLPAGL